MNNEHNINTASVDQAGNIVMIHRSVVPLAIWLFLLSAFLVFILVIVGIAIYYLGPSSNFVLIVSIVLLGLQLIGWIIFTYGVLSWINEYYIIQPTIITIRRGIFSNTEDTYGIEHIQDAKIYQGLFGRIFGYGNLEMYQERGGKTIIFREIKEPDFYRNLIEKMIYGDKSKLPKID